MKQHRVLALIIAIIIGVVLLGLLYPFFAPYQQTSKYDANLQRWQQSQPRHYSYEVRWQDAISDEMRQRDAEAISTEYQHCWQVEIQNGHAVQVHDLTTSQPPNPNMVAYAGRNFVLIDNLFLRIEESLPLQSSIGGYVGSAYSSPVRFLSHHDIPIPTDWICVRPLPKIRYNAQWGYPTYVMYETNPCIATHASLTKVEVTISNFQPLP